MAETHGNRTQKVFTKSEAAIAMSDAEKASYIAQQGLEAFKALMA